jgi:hypothetical protein
VDRRASRPFRRQAPTKPGHSNVQNERRFTLGFADLTCVLRRDTCVASMQGFVGFAR